MADETKVSSGVQELIARLKDEGVTAGRHEAEQLVSEAQERATQIIHQARAEADKLMSDSRATLAAEKEAAKEALRTAIRDTELMLESELKAKFADHVKRLVSMELQDKEFLRKLIAAVVGKTCPEIPKGMDIELLVPRDLFEMDEKGARLTKKGRDQLHHFVLGVSGEMLREGVEIKSAREGEVGMRIRLKGEDVEIDLTDRAIGNVLLKYLLPRYRAIVAGVE